MVSSLIYRVIHLLPPVAKLTLKIMISLSYFADLIYYPSGTEYQKMEFIS
jgi:hypothetical protein